MKAFDKANLKRPEFTIEQGGVTAIIYHEVFMSVREDSETNKNRSEAEQENTSPRKCSEKGSEKTRDKIINEMRNNPNVTIRELATMLFISDRAISKDLKILQEQGIIRGVGADRGGKWKVIE